MQKSRSFRERFLYHLWDRGHLSRRLKAVSGKEVEVLFNGQWNTDSGPDFLGAVVRIGNEVLYGDVEIHRRTSDWTAHRHHENPEYRHVVLHVVLEHDAKDAITRLPDGREIDILALEGQLDSSFRTLLDRYGDTPFEPSDRDCDLLGRLSDPLTFFSNLGMVRLGKKSNRFAAELLFNEFDQILWQGLAESIGYSHNKFQMLALARGMTYDSLREFKLRGESRDAMLGTLLAGAGLLERLPSSFPMIWIAKWRERAHTEETGDPIQWNLFRQRPVNHPGIRLMQVAQLLWDSFDSSLFQRFAACFSQPADAFSVLVMRERVTKLFLDSQGWLPEKYHIGASRVDTFIVNILLPVMLLYSRQMGYIPLQRAVEKSFLDFPPLTGNRVIRSMQTFMPGIKGTKIASVHQQGMIQLHSDFCRHHQCDLCQDAWSLYVRKD